MCVVVRAFLVFWSFLVLFSLPPLPLFHFVFYSASLWLFIFIIFPQSSSLCETGAWVGAGFGGRSRLLGCSCYLGLGSAAPAPGSLGTQPPCATQALILNTLIPWKRNIITLSFHLSASIDDKFPWCAKEINNWFNYVYVSGKQGTVYINWKVKAVIVNKRQ